MKNQVIIDYLSFTVKNNNEFELVGKAKELHHMLESFCKSNCSPLQEYIGGHLYTKGYMSFDGFRTYYGGKDTGNTLYVQISGSGCILLDRYFEGGLLGFMHYILKYQPKIKRIDLAADEIGEADESDEYCFTYERLLNVYMYKLKVGSCKDLGLNSSWRKGLTLYCGSRKSDVFMRIYDKKAEQHINDGGHWMRCELELKNDNALQVFVLLTSGEDFTQKLKDLYTGICFSHIRFIDERKSNISRSVTSQWWTDFLDGVEVGFKFTQKKEYKTIDSLMNWVDHSVLGALKVIYETYGFEYLYKRIDEFVKEGRLSASHQNMIAEFDRELERATNERSLCARAVPDGAETPQQFWCNLDVL